MAKINEYREQINRSLHDPQNPLTKYFELAEKKTNVDRQYLFVGAVGFLGLYLACGWGAELICNSIAFAYPAYQSIKALESPNKADDTKWLCYWVVFACFSILEFFSEIIVSWLPMYWLLKCIFFIWLYMPIEANGSLVLYNRVIRPYYLKHHSKVDDVYNSGKSE